MDSSDAARHRHITIALFAIALASGFAQFGAVASLNDVARHFGHLTSSHTFQSKVGLSGSALGVGLAVLRLSSLFALPLTSLADRFGRVGIMRRTLWVGLIITAVASLSPSYWFFVACFGLARPVLSATSTLVQVTTVELSKTSERIHRLVFMAAGAGIGAGLSAILHGVIRGADSFRWLFLLALVPLFVVYPLVRDVPEPLIRDPQHAMARLGAVPRSLWSRLGIVATVSIVIGIISGPANGFAFVYGEGVLHLRPHVVAIVVTLSAVTGLTGLLVGQQLSRRLGRRTTVVIGIVSSGVAATIAYSGGAHLFVVGYMSGVAAAGLLAPAAAALTTEVFPRAVRATTSGWIVVAGVIGATVGLFVFGYVADTVHSSAHSDLRLPAIVTFLPPLIALLLVHRLPETAGVELT